MKTKIGVIGLGYVGLPLSVELGKYFQVIAFDINKKRISELKSNKDTNNDFKKKKINNKKIMFTIGMIDSFFSLPGCTAKRILFATQF